VVIRTLLQFRSALLAFRGKASVRAVSVMAVSSALGQLAIFCSLPLLSRLYEPAAFGIHATFMAFVGVVTVPVCLCLEQRIVSTADDVAADEIYAGALMSVPVTATIGAAILLVFIVFNFFGYSKLPLWCVPLLGLMVGQNGIYVACRSRVIRQRSFSTVAKAGLSQNVARAVAPLLTFFVAPFWFGLTAGEFLGRSAGVYGLARRVWHRRLTTHVWARPRAWWALVKREYVFTVVLMSTVVIDACAYQLISPIVSATYGSKATGEYFLVALISIGPSVLIGTAAADVIHAKGAEVFFRDPKALTALARKSALMLLGLGAAIFLPVYILAPYVLPPYLGAKWPDVADAVRAFTPYGLMAFIASPCSRLLSSVNRPSIKVISDCVRLVGMPIVLYGSRAAGVPFIQAMWNLSWFLAAAYLLYFVLTYTVVAFVARDGSDQ
jgi:O-antigen/teichoic acid export membrane protein